MSTARARASTSPAASGSDAPSMEPLTRAYSRPAPPPDWLMGTPAMMCSILAFALALTAVLMEVGTIPTSSPPDPDPTDAYRAVQYGLQDGAWDDSYISLSTCQSLIDSLDYNIQGQRGAQGPPGEPGVGLPGPRGPQGPEGVCTCDDPDEFMLGSQGLLGLVADTKTSVPVRVPYARTGMLSWADDLTSDGTYVVGEFTDSDGLYIGHSSATVVTKASTSVYMRLAYNETSAEGVFELSPDTRVSGGIELRSGRVVSDDAMAALAYYTGEYAEDAEPYNMTLAMLAQVTDYEEEPGNDVAVSYAPEFQADMTSSVGTNAATITYTVPIPDEPLRSERANAAGVIARALILDTEVGSSTPAPTVLTAPCNAGHDALGLERTSVGALGYACFGTDDVGVGVVTDLSRIVSALVQLLRGMATRQLISYTGLVQAEALGDGPWSSSTDAGGVNVTHQCTVESVSIEYDALVADMPGGKTLSDDCLLVAEDTAYVLDARGHFAVRRACSLVRAASGSACETVTGGATPALGVCSAYGECLLLSDLV